MPAYYRVSDFYVTLKMRSDRKPGNGMPELMLIMERFACMLNRIS